MPAAALDDVTPVPPSAVRLRDRLSWVGASRVLVLLAAVAAAAVVLALVEVPSVVQLQASVGAAGPLGVLAFVGGYAVAALVPIPKSVLALAAGLVFGLGWGAAAVLAGAVLGSFAAFHLARWIGRDALGSRLDRHAPRVHHLLGRRGLWPVLAMRVVPVVPFTAMNYAAGLSPVRQRDYVLGTALGLVPGTLTYAALGAYGTQPGSWVFAAAAGTAVVMGGAGWLLTRRLRARAEVAAPVAVAA